VNDILEHFGAWPLILLGGGVLGGVAVLVSMAVIFLLRAVESAVTCARNAAQALLGRRGRISPHPLPRWAGTAPTRRTSGEVGRQLGTEGGEET